MLELKLICGRDIKLLTALTAYSAFCDPSSKLKSRRVSVDVKGKVPPSDGNFDKTIR